MLSRAGRRVCGSPAGLHSGEVARLTGSVTQAWWTGRGSYRGLSAHRVDRPICGWLFCQGSHAPASGLLRLVRVAVPHGFALRSCEFEDRAVRLRR